MNKVRVTGGYTSNVNYTYDIDNFNALTWNIQITNLSILSSFFQSISSADEGLNRPKQSRSEKKARKVRLLVILSFKSW